MNKKALELLKRMFESHKRAWTEGDRALGFLEVGWINGVDPRTAETLVKIGLADYEPHPTYEVSTRWVRLKLPLPGEENGLIRLHR